jgi:YVTN family beta-propeller protein
VGAGPDAIAINPAGTRVYVGNQGSNSVSVIDTASNAVVATVKVDDRPLGLAVNPSGTRVIVSNSDNYSIIDTAANTVVATIGQGGVPTGVAMDPARARVYVANLWFGTVYAHDMTNNDLVAELYTGGEVPTSVAANAIGSRVYVGNWGSYSLSVIDATTNTLATVVGMPDRTGPVMGVAVNSAGTRVYVARGYPSNSVTVMDAATYKVIATVPTGDEPGGIAVSRDGTRVYVGTVGDYLSVDHVSVIDTATHTVVATTPIRTPVSFAMHPNGTRIYVSAVLSNSVFAIDTATHRVVAEVALSYGPGGLSLGPTGLAINPAGTRLYVAHGSPGLVSIIDTATNTVSATIAVGGENCGLAINAAGTRVYFVDRMFDRVLVVDATSNAVVGTIKAGMAPCARGQFMGPEAVTSATVEYYHAGLDHYFITWMPNEIAILDAGTQIKGWARTGYSFKTYTVAGSGTSPVCRYYIPPGLGDSHFFGRGTVECDATGQKNPSFVLEAPAFMHMLLPATGICPANTTPVYRAFSNRPDANHRYMTDSAVRDQMVAKGWLAEGDGPDLVVMCAPR